MDLLPTDSIVLPPVVSQGVLLGILWTGSCISILTVISRLAIRWRVLAKFKADDYLVIAGLLFSLASTLIWTVLIGDLYALLNAGATLGTGDFSTLFSRAGKALHGNLASYICSWSCLWSIKLAFIAFFYELGRQIRFQQILWWSILVFVISTYIVCIGILDYGCLTSVGFNIMAKCMTAEVVEYEYSNTRITTAFDIVTDFMIVGLSANIVWRAQVPWKKKVMLACICSLTVVMVVIAVIRITVGAPSKGAPDLSWLLLWNSVEMNLAIFVACIASFRSLYCQSRNATRASEGTPGRSKKKTSDRRQFLTSFGPFTTFGAFTLLDDENAQWSREDLRDNDELPLTPGMIDSERYPTDVGSVMVMADMQKPDRVH
ncbi:unnamed protein product [Clonostachys byssicola]|uniref:Rhodopsin domain-containing protein n=1 Tax=Clonostachys byssicola TaxID=160290 RepID=A0A9N9UJI1_9HYPO|nr:unnamed protein product [Clonostachys byssicola]